MRRSLTARGFATAVALCVLAVSRIDAQAGPPRWSINRDLRIDGDEQDLSAISWIAVARDGSLAVGQRQDYHIRFFDAKGAALGKFGREGEGPGEFRSIALHGWVGDTLWVSDGSTRRITLISPARTLSRTLRWPVGVQTGVPDEAEAVKFMSSVPRGMYADGSLLVISLLSSRAPKPAWARAAGNGNWWVVRTTNDGSFKGIVASLATAGNSCGVSGQNEGGGSWSVSIPFCARPTWSIVPDGAGIVMGVQLGEPGRTEGTYAVTSVASTGDTSFAKQFRYTPIAINKRVADSTRVAFRGSVARQFPPAAARAVDDMKLPTIYPAMRSIIAGRDGTTWIERFTPPGDHLWHVLDASGNLVGAVTLPANVTLHTASRDALWAAEANEDGLQSVIRYRVNRPR